METTIDQRVRGILKDLSLEEKASFCSGKDLWHLTGAAKHNVPEIMVADGPHGLRKEDSREHLGFNKSVPATCFPTAVGLASTWNRDLLLEVGQALGEECLQEGVSVLLGPAMNIKRSPLCGRNFEYFSEDPYLSGECASAWIQGVQSRGIGACVKHYAVNNQEKSRMTIDAIVDERTLHEIYLAGFEAVVKSAHPWTVMAAYNQVNGTFATENEILLTDILRKKWGFDGVVMSDWGAVNDRVLALQAGLDLEMPSSGGINDRLLVDAVKDGTLQEEILDIAVTRLLTLILTAAENRKPSFRYDQTAHQQLVRKAAAESMVLLKNNQQLLPLSSSANIALIGAFAKNPRYQGAGSSLVNPINVENAYDIAQARLGKRLSYAPGYHRNADIIDEKLLSEAAELAKQADVVVIMAGLTEEYESEGFDRSHLQLPHNHLLLIERVSQFNQNVVVVLNNGAPVMMPWLEDVAAVVEAYLPGEAGGAAIWDILLGDTNPSGRLAESFPASEKDYAAARYFPMGPSTVEYRESLYVGYRYYDSARVTPLFPFGYGLSYTTFAYSDLTLTKERFSDHETVDVTVIIENTGSVAGQEVIQLYVKDVAATVFRPEKELKEFAKVWLEPGEKKTVCFTLHPRAFAYYNPQLQSWQVESGDFLIMIGASSQDIRCARKLHVASTVTPIFEGRYEMLPSYHQLTADWSVTQQEFAHLLGRDVPASKNMKPFHRNSTLTETTHNMIGRILYKLVMMTVKKRAGGDAVQARMMEVAVRELPLRGLVMMSGGAISFEKLDGLIDLMNGKIFSGLALLLRRKKQ